MDKETIYRKTAAGADAIATRHAALGPRQRSLLILVDGRRNAGELATLVAAGGDAGDLLQGLLAQGFIEPLPAARAAAAPASPEAKPAMPLAQARSLAVRRLNDMLGPSATDLCLRLEAAHDAHEFLIAVRRIEAALREVVGPQRAAQFLSEVENVRGA